MHRNVPILVLRAAVGLLSVVLLVSPEARAEAHTDPILGRLISGRGLSVGRPRPVTDAELRHYARFVALDLETNPPTVRVWMRLGPEGYAAVQALGIGVLGRAGNLASASVPLPRLAALARAPGVLSIQATRRLHAELDVSLPEVGADLGHDLYNARGAGAVLGIVDDGIDITHDDFRNADGSTRIKFLWNQTFNCGTPPPGFGYGCLYSETDINNVLLLGVGSVSAPDNLGHGTHVTGVAAGNGRQTGNGQPAGTYVGMAPEADIIHVKTLENLASCGQCDAGDALAFIDQKAAELGQPWVANMSFGTDHDSPHDGTDALEQVIDALTGSGIPGKVTVNSSGNDGGQAIHISGTVGLGSSNEHTFTIDPYTPNPGSFDDVHIFTLWYENADNLTVRITSPRGQFLQASTGSGFSATGTADGVILINDGTNAFGTRFFEMELDDQIPPPPRQGTWTLRVTGNNVTAGGHYDAWTWFSDLGGGPTPGWDNPDLDKLVTVPGTSFDVTTVGAYVTRTNWIDVTGTPRTFSGTLGSLAFFSSRGPSRDDRQKPEINAPGQVIVSSLAAAASASPDEIVEDGEHLVALGTSFAAPHVAGLYAQMLGLNPGLDAIQLRSLIQETARSDGFTGGVPNSGWGFGKMDAQAALDMVVKPVTNLRWTSTTHYMWDDIAPLATTYNVYRALVSQLDGTFYGNCTHSGLATPSVNESVQPPFGDGFFYLISGVKDGIEGRRGFLSNGILRNSLNLCP